MKPVPLKDVARRVIAEAEAHANGVVNVLVWSMDLSRLHLANALAEAIRVESTGRKPIMFVETYHTPPDITDTKAYCRADLVLEVSGELRDMTVWTQKNRYGGRFEVRANAFFRPTSDGSC